MHVAGNFLGSLIALALALLLPFFALAEPADATAKGVQAPQRPATAESAGSEISPSPVPTLELTQPAAPTPSSKDWIQLKSGEWLRGVIKRMRDRSLEFDSDELDDLTIDWKDVIEVRSPVSHTYVFERDRNQFSVTGQARIDRTRVFVQLGEEVHDYPREELVAILKGETERDYWSGSLSLGLTIRAGNTEQVEFSSFGWIRRETDRTRVRLDYNGTFSALSGRSNANNHRGLLACDYFVSRKLYLTPVRLEAFTDEFQNVGYRLNPSVGVGYKLVRWRSVEWDIDVGAGYQFTRFDSVPDGEPESEEGGALVLGTRFESDITKRTDVAISYKLNLGLSKSVQTSHHAEFVISVDIYKAIDLDINLTWDRLENPPENSEGIIPKENDTRLVVGFGLEF